MYVVPQGNDYGAVEMIVIKCYVKQANTKRQTTQIGLIVLLEKLKMDKKTRTYSSDNDNDNSNDKLKNFYTFTPYSNVMTQQICSQ